MKIPLLLSSLYLSNDGETAPCQFIGLALWVFRFSDSSDKLACHYWRGPSTMQCYNPFRGLH